MGLVWAGRNEDEREDAGRLWWVWCVSILVLLRYPFFCLFWDYVDEVMWDERTMAWRDNALVFVANGRKRFMIGR